MEEKEKNFKVDLDMKRVSYTDVNGKVSLGSLVQDEKDLFKWRIVWDDEKT